ncbi:MAG: hypothetical protein ACKOWF_18715, partial [Chloroflexota bacterium]
PGLSSLLHSAEANDAPAALATRFSAGWPENPAGFRPLAAALDREVGAWVVGRATAPGGSPPPLLTGDAFTNDLLANPDFSR